MPEDGDSRRPAGGTRCWARHSDDARSAARSHSPPHATSHPRPIRHHSGRAVPRHLDHRADDVDRISPARALSRQGRGAVGRRGGGQRRRPRARRSHRPARPDDSASRYLVGIARASRARRTNLAHGARSRARGQALEQSRLPRVRRARTRIRRRESHYGRAARRRRGDARRVEAGTCPLLTQSAATVPKSYPGTEMRGIGCPITRSIVRTIAISSGDMNVYASPSFAARPVRPMRCT